MYFEHQSSKFLILGTVIYHKGNATPKIRLKKQLLSHRFPRCSQDCELLRLRKEVPWLQFFPKLDVLVWKKHKFVGSTEGLFSAGHTHNSITCAYLIFAQIPEFVEGKTLGKPLFGKSISRTTSTLSRAPSRRPGLFFFPLTNVYKGVNFSHVILPLPLLTADFLPETPAARSTSLIGS